MTRLDIMRVRYQALVRGDDALAAYAAWALGDDPGRRWDGQQVVACVLGMEFDVAETEQEIERALAALEVS